MKDVVQGHKIISVVVVDDHQLLTDALALILRSEHDIRMIGVAGSIAEGHVVLKKGCPDVLLLDISLPDGDGLELVPYIKNTCAATNIVVLTAMANEKNLLRALAAGVGGFMSKSRPLLDILVAIRQAAEGEIVMPSSLVLDLLTREHRSHADLMAEHGIEPLTPREQQILTLLARGQSGATIAAELNIAPHTVRTHIRNLMDKLHVHTRLEAVIWALRHELIDPPN